MIQRMNLHRGQILTKSNINNILNSAKGTYSYARFEMYNKIYISIFFNKDNTVEISTNSRNIALWNRLEVLRRNNTISMLVDFIFFWIPILNR